MPLEGVEMTGSDPVRPELHIDCRAFRDDNQAHSILARGGGGERNAARSNGPQVA